MNDVITRRVLCEFIMQTVPTAMKSTDVYTFFTGMPDELTLHLRPNIENHRKSDSPSFAAA